MLNALLSKCPIIGLTIAAAAAVLQGCSDGRDSQAADPAVMVDSPAGPGSLAPHLAVTPAGNAILSWLEPGAGTAHVLRYSVFRNDAWSEPGSIAESTGWFVNWADFPSVVPLSDSHWAAHWLVKRPGGTYAYDIAVAGSTDSGVSWSVPASPHDDGTPTEHGFVSFFPWNGDMGAVWLDGRNMKPDAGGDSPADPAQTYGGMTLRYARLGMDGVVLEEGEIDNQVCECCQTDAAMTTSGPIVAYRDRASDEIRDIAVTRLTSAGWQSPLIVSDDHWQIAGCPVNGPAIAAEDNRVVVAWYGSPNRESRVKVAWSHDGGQSFAAPIVIDESVVRGRVDVSLLPDGSAAVSWIGKPDDDTGELRMRTVTMDGALTPVQVIATGAYSRNAGFPQMVRAGSQLVYAWPEAGDERSIHTAVARLEQAQAH